MDSSFNWNHLKSIYAFPPSNDHGSTGREVRRIRGHNDPNSPTGHVSYLGARNSQESSQIRDDSSQQTTISICWQKFGLSIPRGSNSLSGNILPSSKVVAPAVATPVSSSDFASLVSFTEDSSEGLPPVAVSKASQTSGVVSAQHVASQFPEPHNEALFRFLLTPGKTLGSKAWSIWVSTGILLSCP